MDSTLFFVAKEEQGEAGEMGRGDVLVQMATANRGCPQRIDGCLSALFCLPQDEDDEEEREKEQEMMEKQQERRETYLVSSYPPNLGG